MLFKTKKIGRDWDSYKSPYQKRNEKLKMFVGILEDISELVGCGELLVTDYLRYGERNIHSLHHELYGCACDIRVRDKSNTWMAMMSMVGVALAIVDYKIRMNPHWELFRTNDQHLHLEVRA